MSGRQYMARAREIGLSRTPRVAEGHYAGGGGGGAVAVALGFIKITGRAGVEPPWRYSGVEVEHDGSSGFAPENYGEKSGGITVSGDLINLQEIGTAGVGVNPLLDDSIVGFWSMGGRYACSVSNYRGTYP